VKRFLTGISIATLLVAILPGAVSADRLTKFQDHHVGVSCESAFAGGYASAFIDSSSNFGDFGGASVWLDPAVRFQDPPTLSGSSDAVVVVEGATEIHATTTFAVVDPDGAPLGDGMFEATMTRVGDPVPTSQPSLGNHHSATQGTIQSLEGTASLHLPGLDLELSGCSGDITDTSVFEANPRSFVIDTQGVVITCFWETPDTAASFFAIQDQFGFSADASLIETDLLLFNAGSSSGTIDSTGLSATVALVDEGTGDPYSVAAHATFVPNGTPVTSTLIGSTASRKITEQALTPTGQVAFSTGDTFATDDEHCDTSAFQAHTVSTAPAGPKPGGKAPANDTAAGAIAIAPGDRLNVQTGNASLDAELQLSTCPEGFGDQMGRTLWYTVIGTGDPVTIDTAGSNFDTLIGVYEGDLDSLSEIACDDDVFSAPIGSSYQAAVTFDTVDGVVYHVQVGGFMNPFGGDPQFGRLRLAVS
jgi:hypothetical protein